MDAIQGSRSVLEVIGSFAVQVDGEVTERFGYGVLVRLNDLFRRGSSVFELAYHAGKLLLVARVSKEHEVLSVVVDVAHLFSLYVDVLRDEYHGEIVVVAFLSERFSHHDTVAPLEHQIIEDHRLGFGGVTPDMLV